VTAVSARAAANGCRVDYTVASRWADGFTGDVTITNLGDPVSGWILTCGVQRRADGDPGVERPGDADGAQVTARSAGWNDHLATNATVNFGFNGAWTSSNPSPTSFALNDTTCTGMTSPTTAPPTTAPPSSPPATAVRYEAEASPAVCTGTIDANGSGYSGTGFCNGDNGDTQRSTVLFSPCQTDVLRAAGLNSP